VFCELHITQLALQNTVLHRMHHEQQSVLISQNCYCQASTKTMHTATAATDVARGQDVSS
jgi:hypothetical protein